MRNRLLTFFDFFENIFRIREGKKQEEETIANIRENVSFKGDNLWSLIFAIFIASIGLNINSTAIVIGAMLISPLMGPIVGLGLSLGINDSVLLRRSLKNIGVATIIGIVISTIYFWLSPIDGLQSELFIRTNPNIFDVLIAFFGGLAGVVGSIRANKNNVIPGVAIATALMPPLCTIGYGLATLQVSVFFGALYLYAINCIFICIATLLGVKYLKLPSVKYLDEKHSEKMKKIITSIVFIMIVPSLYFAYTLIKENNFNKEANVFIKDNFTNKGFTVIHENLDFKSNPHKIELAFLYSHLTQMEIDNLQRSLINYGLMNTELVIKQDNALLTEDEWNMAIANIKNESEKVRAIAAKLSSNFINYETTAQVLKEAQSINGSIVKIAIGKLTLADSTQGNTSTLATSTQMNKGDVLAAFIYTDPKLKSLSTQEKETLTSWIKSRMNSSEVIIYFLKFSPEN